MNTGSMRPPSNPKTLSPTVFWRLAEDIPRPLNTLLVATSIGLPLLIWWLVTTFGSVDPKFLPSPAKVLEAFGRLWRTRELLKDTVASLWRVGVGFLLAVVLSIPVGVLMGSFASIRALLEPLFGLMRYMPAPAFIPLLILYLGIGEEPKITLIFIGVFFFNSLMVMDTVKFVSKDLIEAAYTLGGDRWQTLTQVIFPHVLPGIIDACRINLAAAWQLVIVSELIAATEGLGRRISVAGRFLRTDEIFVGLIVIGIIGLTFDLLFQWLLRVSCKWASQKR
ncbi:MAG: putative aliphatic sulfonates transport permease protein SsuC [Chroococcidiopsis cubana SAG 39.79]|jgi:NitT/TauT family transport system permease protein|uniref:Binding-protein-dependent transport systems inner membrane component n=2 Tax=Chroococcidiopsis TaxID=54298 RepID=K9TWL2_CHRTP|nr:MULTISPECIES: ABC transporter permease [Chroococcidiopsis]PSB45720.1 ABC transporter permease [Cyanosarcina cf. burmensis CCALA 770]AFY87227.1 binding-protein-dependent transport systems inner membrane component [Chroococcidiopsis thermalis PCC 7203]MDZ4874580.1 putative aliphatic sulfonates transport permease protein SsuC [Chroococcidiopsis cubana SAG 39.79]PSB58262.1 ABC transporter permease [Chroococcidiopsis cubana CCALA 043]RUT10963.1 ABC transporter permease [Chroococcidiopsis cubana 